MNFVDEARRAAVRWKGITKTLPEAARESAAYRGATGPPLPFCLPAAFARYNLLPAGRDHGLLRFEELRIPWHHGVDGSPNNHLLSSQVQCVNALAPFAQDPSAVRRLFGAVLDIAEPLPFGSTGSDGDDLIVFEWIGEDDYLGESGSGLRTRGAKATSADAAIRALLTVVWVMRRPERWGVRVGA